MSGASPAFADIYGLNPLVILGGDAHDAQRRSAVVAVQSDYVKALGRSTTEPHDPPRTLQSAPDPDCRLDKPGVYALRFQHSVHVAEFNDVRRCAYFGHLSPTAEADLHAFWEQAMYG